MIDVSRRPRGNLGGGHEPALRAQGSDRVTLALAPLVLASGSNSRKALLTAAGVPSSPTGRS